MAGEAHSSQIGSWHCPLAHNTAARHPQSQLGAEQTHAESRAVRRGWNKHQTFKGVTLNGQRSLRA